MDMEAELVSLRKVKEEYERSLKVHQVAAQADRQAANEIHFETIKVSLLLKSRLVNIECADCLK